MARERRAILERRRSGCLRVAILIAQRQREIQLCLIAVDRRRAVDGLRRDVLGLRARNSSAGRGAAAACPGTRRESRPRRCPWRPRTDRAADGSPLPRSRRRSRRAGVASSRRARPGFSRRRRRLTIGAAFGFATIVSRGGRRQRRRCGGVTVIGGSVGTDVVGALVRRTSATRATRGADPRTPRRIRARCRRRFA